MPATVETDPPRIWCMFSNGNIARFSLGGLPCPGLAEDLLTGLAGLIHPHGRVDAAGTAGVYIRAFREMTRTLAAAGFGQAADLRRPRLTAFWMGTTADRESCTRRALGAFARDGGTLHPAVAELTAGRNFNPVFYHKPLPPYCEAEWERLAATCAAVADASFAAHKEALAAAARGSRPGKGRWSREASPGCWPGPARSGRPGSGSWRAVTRGGPQAERLPGSQRGPVPGAGHGDRLPAAIRHLLRHRAGRHRGPVRRRHRLGRGRHDPAVLRQAPHLRGEPEPAPPGSTAARAVAQPLGTAAQPHRPGRRERLWLGTSHPGGDMLIKKVNRVGIQRWILRHDVTGDDGGPLRIHRSRIRTTHLSLRDKSTWAGRGRATIDPNHSPQVEGDHYLTAATPAQQQSVDVIVADAQHDLIRRAHPPAILADADTAALARDYPQLAASLGLDDGVLAELVSGTRDVFAAVRRPAGRTARAEGTALPGQAVGLPALPAGGLRPPARRQPAAAEGVLLPAVAADARRPVHGRVRPVLPADRPGTGPLRSRRPGPGSPPRRRRRQRTPAASRGAHPMTAAVLPFPHPGRSPFAGTDICRQAVTLPDGAARPRFNDYLWYFTEMTGLRSRWPSPSAGSASPRSSTSGGG